MDWTYSYAVVPALVIILVSFAALYKETTTKSKVNSEEPPIEIPSGSKFLKLSSGIKIRFKDTGFEDKSLDARSITTLLMIHGFGGCIETYSAITDLLRDKFRIVAIDLVGNGFSDKPFDFEYTFRNQGNVVMNIIEEMDLQNVILVGHSSGCIVCTSTPASSKSERVKGAILISPGIFQYYPPIFSYRIMRPIISFMVKSFCENRRAKLLKHHKNKEKLSTEVLKAFESITHTKNYRETMVEAMSTLEPPYRDLLKDVKIPLLFIWSDEDKTNAPAEDKVKSLINDGTLNAPVATVILTDSYHYIHHEQPEKVAADIMKFVESTIHLQ